MFMVLRHFEEIDTNGISECCSELTVALRRASCRRRSHSASTATELCSPVALFAHIWNRASVSWLGALFAGPISLRTTPSKLLSSLTSERSRCALWLQSWDVFPFPCVLFVSLCIIEAVVIEDSCWVVRDLIVELV